MRFRFMHEGIQTRDFRNPVFARGGIVHLAWKGEAADQIELVVRLEEEVRTFEWSVRLVRDGYEFYVEERVDGLPRGSPPTHLLESRRGEGWWWSGEEGERVELKQARTSCALAAAAADASFPARDIAEFVRRWGFFDPNPFLLRRDWASLDSDRFDPVREKSGRDALRAAQVVAGSPGGDRCRDAGGRRAAVGYRASGVRGSLLLRTVRAWTRLPRASDGRVRRDAAHVGADDGASRGPRCEFARNRGTRELRPPYGAVRLRPTPPGRARPYPAHGDHPFPPAARFSERTGRSPVSCDDLAMREPPSRSRRTCTGSEEPWKSRDSVSGSSTRRRVSGPIEVTKHVIVLASGETERRALPHLVSHLRDRDVSVDEVRVPPRNRALDLHMAESLVKAAWFESAGRSSGQVRPSPGSGREDPE